MPRKDHSEERKEATIRAVWAVIARGGIDAVTIDAVAALAGFSKGVIHYYFDSKRAMILAAFEAYLESYDAEILERLKALGRKPSGEEIVGAIIEASLPAFSPSQLEPRNMPLLGPGEGLTPEYKARLFLQFFSIAMGDADFRAVVRKSYDRQGEAIADCYASLLPGISRDEAVDAAACLMALIDGFSLHRVLGYRPEGMADHAELARRFLAACGETKRSPA